MKKNKVYVDVNIILEILNRRKNYEFAKKIFEDENNILLISILTVHLVYYFAKKYEIDIELIKELLELCEILESGQKEYSLAQIFYLQNHDMEDAIQIATAFSHKIDVFTTLDKNLIKKFEGKTGFKFITI